MLRWLVNTTVIKIAVVALLIKEIWLLMGVPSVMNAFIAFCTVGQIPGTDTTLTPSQTFQVLWMLFALAAIIIFNKELRLLLIRRPTTVSGAQAKKLPVPSVAPMRKSHRNLLPKLPEQYVARARAVRAAVANLVVTAYYNLTAQLRRSLQWLVPYAVVMRHHVHAALVVIRLALAGSCRFVWRWAEPRIRAYDKWLEIQLNHNRYSRMMLAFGAELIAQLGLWATKLKSMHQEALANHQTRKSGPTP